MRTLGVDLASATSNTAACIVEWDEGAPRLDLLLGGNVDDDTIVRLSATVDVTGIDAPFGWPRPFADVIWAYAAGEPWPRQRPEGLWLRRTDERAKVVASGRAGAAVGVERSDRASRGTGGPPPHASRDGRSRRRSRRVRCGDRGLSGRRAALLGRPKGRLQAT